MIDLGDNPEEEYRRLLREEYLPKLEVEMIESLRALINHDYPPEIFAVCFELFDHFSDGSPVRAFFMDRTNTEYFIELGENRVAPYPDPVDPGLLDIEGVYPREVETAAIERDIDTWGIDTEEFVRWFSQCWDKAGGADFARVATIAGHDEAEEFNLRTHEWQEAFAEFEG